MQESHKPQAHTSVPGCATANDIAIKNWKFAWKSKILENRSEEMFLNDMKSTSKC